MTPEHIEDFLTTNYPSAAEKLYQPVLNRLSNSRSLSLEDVARDVSFKLVYAVVERASKRYKDPASVADDVLIGNLFSSDGLKRLAKVGDVEAYIKAAIRDPMERVRIPFADEYPSLNQWNRDAPQLKYSPAPGPHPHWNLITSHIGAELDDGLSDGRLPGISNGQAYIQAWLASIVQKPACRLPYLFLYGPQDSGKSILHEAFSLLVTRGVMQADRALTSRNDFNSELDGTVLAAVEEKNIRFSAGAAAKVKDAVTARKLSIRRLYHDSYETDNYTHWIHTSNEIDACPIPRDDTRIVALTVPQLGDSLIPKDEFRERLVKEAPAFTHSLVRMKLPEPEGRLALPVIQTPTRHRIQHVDSTLLERWLDAQTDYILDGHGCVQLRDVMQTINASGIGRYTTKGLKRDILLLNRRGLEVEGCSLRGLSEA